MKKYLMITTIMLVLSNMDLFSDSVIIGPSVNIYMDDPQAALSLDVGYIWDDIGFYAQIGLTQRSLLGGVILTPVDSFGLYGGVGYIATTMSALDVEIIDNVFYEGGVMVFLDSFGLKIGYSSMLEGSLEIAIYGIINKNKRGHK